MKSPPTERQRSIVARRREGIACSAIAREFGTTYEQVRRAISLVERYDRGMQILRSDPASLEGLELVGELRTLAARSLSSRGYRTLHDLADMTLIDLLVMPNVSRKEAEMLVRLAKQAKPAMEKALLAQAAGR